MNPVFEKNLLVLEQHQKALYESLKPEIEKYRAHPNGDSDKSYAWHKTSGEAINLVYHDSSKNQKFLVHAEDPADEALEIFKRANLINPQLVGFFGIGLGYMLQTFYKDRPPQNFVIAVFEKDPQIFLRAISVFDFEEIFKDVTVRWSIGASLIEVKNLIAYLHASYSTVNRNIKILALPSALHTEPEFYKQVAENLIATRDVGVINAGNSIEDSYIGIKNVTENIPRALSNPGFMPLKNICEGKSIISVAAGPSLEEHWDELRELQGKVPIICCDVLLKKMLEKGIEPDIVTAVERTDTIRKLFQDVEIPKKTILVGPLFLQASAIEAFKGDTYLFCPFLSHGGALGLDFLVQFNSGSSAGNLNLTFANWMGFKNIIMVGHDLAYSHDGSRSHVSGTGVKQNEREYKDDDLLYREEVETQDGSSKVKTQAIWKQFRVQIEQLLAKASHKNWVNTSAKGAKIEGATHMSLKEALEKYANQDFDFFEVRKLLPREVAVEEYNKREKTVYQNMNYALDSLEDWLEKGRKLLKKFPKWSEEIQERELRGRPVSLAYLDEAIDEVLKIKVGAVNKDRWFCSVAITLIHPAHMTFESEVNNLLGQFDDNYELKKAFLLRHESYFKIWDKWLPVLIEELRQHNQPKVRKSFNQHLSKEAEPNV